MLIKPYHISEADFAEAEAWLDKRAEEIDGYYYRIGWKEHCISSMVASAVKPKKYKGKDTSSANHCACGYGPGDCSGVCSVCGNNTELEEDA